jgi:geranylgeranyl diphosphate synthase type I
MTHTLCDAPGERDANSDIDARNAVVAQMSTIVEIGRVGRGVMVRTMGASAIETRPAHEVLSWSRRLVDPALREAVDTLPTSMRRIAGYHFGWRDADGRPTNVDGGKGFRPTLALLAAAAVGGDAMAALPVAVAVELVHNFSLIQDDVIDGDLSRHGRPTVWSVFGVGSAIVAGDALLALAFDVLAGDVHPASRRMVRMLSTAVLEMTEGEQADISFETRPDVELAECLSMVEGKTGSMLACACALGAASGGGTAAQVAALYSFGEQVGTAFQLADDLLGIWGDPAVTGKPVHSDLHRRKKSLPLVAALCSDTAAGRELATLYRRDRPLSAAEVVRAAELVDLAGGRSWCLATADDLLAGALDHLHAAVGSSRASAELVALARLAAHRDV